jgi:hypothetical protein
MSLGSWWGAKWLLQCFLRVPRDARELAVATEGVLDVWWIAMLPTGVVPGSESSSIVPDEPYRRKMELSRECVE